MKKYICFIIALLSVLCYAEDTIPVIVTEDSIDNDSVIYFESGSNLRLELEKDEQKYEEVLINTTNEERRMQQQFLNDTKRCTQLKLQLYSFRPGNLFVISRLLRYVEDQYQHLEKSAQAPLQTLASLQQERQRYENLLALLENEHIDTVSIQITQSYLETLFYTENTLLRQHAQYDSLLNAFQPVYDYAQERQEILKEQIFSQHEITFSDILARPKQTIGLIQNDLRYTYQGRADAGHEVWIVLMQMFGAIFAAILLTLLVLFTTRNKPNLFPVFKRNPAICTNQVYMCLLIACLAYDVQLEQYPLITANAIVYLVYFLYVLTLQTSLLIRQQGEQASKAMRLYVPSIAYGMAVIFLRMFFVPDSILSFLVFPLSIGCAIWQNIVCFRYWNQVKRIDAIVCFLTTLVLIGLSILSAFGHAFIALIAIYWWEAQQVAILLLAACLKLLYNYEPILQHRKEQFLIKSGKSRKMSDSAIEITWMHDLTKQVILPLLAIASIPLCIYFALDFIHAGNQFLNMLDRPLINFGEKDLIAAVTLKNSLLVFALFIIFRFLSNIGQTIYKQLHIAIDEHLSRHTVKHSEHINISLGQNIIITIVWVIYIIIVFVLMEIPLRNLTFIFAGLVTGLGFAMRDIINNLIYGAQLMAGRLRVGDYIICDGYRGVVTSISYQTTQMHTEENALVSFTNADLLNKNFQNLTREDPYEVNRVTCDIAYGSDVTLAEKLIREAIEGLNTQDKFGRYLLSPKEGVRIEMRDLDTSSIQMAVRFAVIAEKRTWFLPVARKAVYENLMKGKIPIPFPQVDVHIQAPPTLNINQ